MTSNNQFHWHGHWHTIHQLIGASGEPRSRRITLTCSEKRFHQIDARTDNNSRYLEMAVDLMEAYIGRTGRLSPRHIKLICKLMTHADAVTSLLEGMDDPELDTVLKLYAGGDTDTDDAENDRQDRP